MTDVKRRQMAADIANMIVDTLGDNAPGLVMVIVANESEIQEGRIELDAAMKGTGAYTEAGADGLSRLGGILTARVKAAAAELAEGGGQIVERPDLGLPGPRGES